MYAICQRTESNLNQIRDAFEVEILYTDDDVAYEIIDLKGANLLSDITN